MEKKKTASIFGASGLVGTELVKLLVVDTNYDQLIIGNRKQINYSSSKVKEVIVDFGSLEKYQSLFKVDDVFVCLGTTIKKAGSKEKFEYVDYQLPKEIANGAKKANVECFTMITSLDANANSSNFYLKTKGRVEDYVNNLNLKNCFFVRPSLLLGKRKEKRLVEGIAQWWMKKADFLFLGSLKKYKAIEAKEVAKAIIYISQEKPNGTSFSSSQLHDFSKQYKNEYS